MFNRALPVAAVAIVISTSLTSHAQLVNQRKGTDMKLQLKEPWSETKCKVILRGEKTPTSVTGRKAKYEAELGPNKIHSTSVTSFVAPQTGNPWVGPEGDYYLETDAGIEGIKLSHESLLWRDSLAKDSKPKPGMTATIDQVVADFDKNVTRDQLFKEEWSIDPDPDTKQVRRTHLQEVIKNPFFFAAAPLSSESGNPQITGIGMDQGLLKIDMKSQTGEYKATVWIDVKKRKATKADFDEFKLPVPKSPLPDAPMPSNMP